MNCVLTVLHYLSIFCYLLYIFCGPAVFFLYTVAPRIQDALFRQQSVDETKSFIVNCTVFSNPASNIAFTSSPAITASPSVSSSGLIPYSGALYTIAAAPVQGFSYIYNITCTATNTLASASAVTQVTVNGEKSVILLFILLVV